MRSFFSRLGLPLCFLTCTGFSGETSATNFSSASLACASRGSVARAFCGLFLRRDGRGHGGCAACAESRALGVFGGGGGVVQHVFCLLLFGGLGLFAFCGLLFLFFGSGLFGGDGVVRLRFRIRAVGYVFLYGGGALVAHRRDGGEDGGHAVIGIAVRDDFAVHELDYARGVTLRELRIVRDHDDQPVVRDLLQKVHDLLRRLGVESARGLVGEDDLGIVDDGAGDGDALHLSAGHLVGFLFELGAQPHALERVDGELPLFLVGDTGYGQREFDVLEHVQVGDKVVGLENEAYRTVAVGVPIAGTEFLGGLIVDDEVAVGVLIQAADDVEQRGLAAAGRPQNGDEFALAEIEVDAFHGVHDGVRHAIVLDDVDEFKHAVDLTADGCPSAPPGSRNKLR